MKKVNPTELQRVLDDIVTFASEWQARTFAATARKVKELHPNVDLFEHFRLVEWEVDVKLGQNSVELYDLLRDPHESHNLGADAADAPLVTELRGRLKNGWRGEKASE